MMNEHDTAAITWGLAQGLLTNEDITVLWQQNVPGIIAATVILNWRMTQPPMLKESECRMREFKLVQKGDLPSFFTEV
jgi:hypothetical protein